MKAAVKTVVLLALAVLLLAFGVRKYYEAAYPLEYTATVERYADSNGVSPSLVYAIIRTESHFDAEAVSHAGARGLMQLMEDTFVWAQELDTEGFEKPLDTIELFDPEINVCYGTRVLRWLLEELSVPETALAAYNAGIGRVREWLQDPRYSADGKTLHTIPFPETAAYVQRVLSAQKQYQTLYDLP